MKLLVYFFLQRPGESVSNRQLFLQVISVPKIFAGTLWPLLPGLIRQKNREAKIFDRNYGETLFQ
jgi:hypothetical protein